MTTVCYEDGEKRDLPFGEAPVLHDNVLFVRFSAPEN